MRKIREGDVFKVNQGNASVVVLEYNSYTNVKVKYLNDIGNVMTVRADHLREGRIKNPYHRTALGVGYIGQGPFKSGSKGRHTRCYSAWYSMLERCYSEKRKIKNPTYNDVTVCEEWHNFQNFAEWFYQQPNAEKRGYDLDKDLIIVNNKVYCPEACSFVPQEVNKVLLMRDKDRDGLPRGVYEHCGKYQVSIVNTVGYGLVYLGTYSTLEEALVVYEEGIRSKLQQVADLYKENIDSRVYENLKKGILIR